MIRIPAWSLLPLDMFLTNSGSWSGLVMVQSAGGKMEQKGKEGKAAQSTEHNFPSAGVSSTG